MLTRLVTVRVACIELGSNIAIETVTSCPSARDQLVKAQHIQQISTTSSKLLLLHQCYIEPDNTCSGASGSLEDWPSRVRLRFERAPPTRLQYKSTRVKMILCNSRAVKMHSSLVSENCI